MTGARVILGSASPRRRALLSAAGLAFTIDTPEIDESLVPGLEPERAALQLAQLKARAVAARHAGERAVVLAADTIVAVGPELLGKPVDERQAAGMLRALSSSRHRVVTGVCVRACDREHEASAVERTWVTMRALSPHEIEAYVASGEWRDKAGGYAIQESADRFVTLLEEGGFDNVVGLPVDLALRLLSEAGVLVPGAQRG